MLPKYGYDFTQIGPIDEINAKLRVIKSLARHYETEDPATFYTRDEVKAETTATMQGIEKMRTDVAALATATHVQTLVGNIIGLAFISQQTYTEYLKNLEKLNLDLDVVVRQLKELFKNITNIDIGDLRALADAFDVMYSEYANVVKKDTELLTENDQVREPRPAQFIRINANNMRIDMIKLRAAWLQVFTKMEEAKDTLAAIISNYNERRRTLYSRDELRGSGYVAYSLSPETYAPSQYV
jgi:hypothetical protein